MNIIESVGLTHEGVELQGYLALPRGEGPHPAVLVMHNAHGLGEQMRDSAKRLAEAGYVALATDMFGGGRYIMDPEEIAKVAVPLMSNVHLLRRRANAWVELLKARAEVDAKRVAAIGYCFGGQCVLELARSGADVKLVVSYHGLLQTTLPAEPDTIKAQVAVYSGGKDPYVPREHVSAFQDEMVAAGASWQITVFGDALHSFTDPDTAATGIPGVGYDKLAHRVSWAGTEVLLDAVL